MSEDGKINNNTTHKKPSKLHVRCTSHKDVATERAINIALNDELAAHRLIDNQKKITIDVVVHILYQSSPSLSTTADINEMMTTLNNDFNGKAANFDTAHSRYMGSDPDKAVYSAMLDLKGSANITFRRIKTIYKKLTKKIPNDLDLDSKNRIIKGSSGSKPINPLSCLNIWVVENIGGDLLGYATFPWQSHGSVDKLYDGVVIDRSVFGVKPRYTEYNLNKTVVHEVGHWFGLYHTFQQGSVNTLSSKSIIDYNNDKVVNEQEKTGDCVIDTPVQSDPTYGNPLTDGQSWPYTDIVNSDNTTTKSWHMFMNFMDYSNDDCMFMFTRDQVVKLRLLLLMLRPQAVKYL